MDSPTTPERCTLSTSGEQRTPAAAEHHDVVLLDPEAVREAGRAERERADEARAQDGWHHSMAGQGAV